MHDDRVRAESFGALAAVYDRARPTYPAELVDALLAGGAPRVLDVGCGTGIAGALLAARGCDVLGVEVDARMAAIARGKGLAVEVAPFERWEAGGRRFDLVIAAQSWHWIEPHAGAAQVADVLAHGGRVGVFWNTGDPQPPARERLDAVYAALEPGLREQAVVSAHRHRRAQLAVQALAQSGRFGPVALTRFPWRTRYETAAWLDYLRSHSDHATLPTARRTALLGAVREVLETLGGGVEVAYTTVLVSARRR